MLDGENIYWLEGRPVERGRQVVVQRLFNGDVSDIVLPPFNARTRIYEYGGAHIQLLTIRYIFRTTMISASTGKILGVGRCQ